MIPVLRWVCLDCATELHGDVEQVAEHAQSHGEELDRWPDGSVVVDMSDAPVLIEETT
jgi:hypothetical protein